MALNKHHQSALHPHNLSAQRIAQIEKWRLQGAAARRGKHLQQRSTFHAKRAKGKSITAGLARSTGWGLQKFVVPVGIGGPIVALAKNRLPGYNQYQIAKASGHTASGHKHVKRAAKKR